MRGPIKAYITSLLAHIGEETLYTILIKAHLITNAILGYSGDNFEEDITEAVKRILQDDDHTDTNTTE